MVAVDEIVANTANEWRLAAPEVEGWVRDVRPGTNKHFIVSVDTHMSPPIKLFHERMDRKFHEFLPTIEKRENGERYILMPGTRPERLIDVDFDGDDLVRSKSGADLLAKDLDGSVITGLQRIADQDRDGVDAEVIFPNGAALLMWSSRNNEIYNFYRPLRVGDTLRTEQRLATCSQLRKTRLGEGYFTSGENLLFNQHGELVRTTTLNLFCYRG